ncbi:MAG: hypothetical protein IPJ75_00630 [Ignavibacteriales bacterium]|nr:hypothetical protein [Ignavibacteriales bacterium]
MELKLTPFETNFDYDIKFNIESSGESLLCSYIITGNITKLNLKEGRSAKRQSFLWLDTCFEFFLKEQNSSDYYEFNFASNSDYNIFHFPEYRAPLTETNNFSVDSRMEIESENKIVFDFQIFPHIDVAGKEYTFLASVILNTHDKIVSLWAVDHAHPKADFHGSKTYKNRIRF